MKLNPDIIFDRYVRVFSPLSASQQAGLLQILTFLTAGSFYPDDHRCAAYLLATIKHECADKWVPVQERGTPDYFIAHYWDKPTVRRQLGNIAVTDAVRYCGRGYVQITGRGNYARFGSLLNLDLVGKPDTALLPVVSFAIAARGMQDGLFTGGKLSAYINHQQCDYYHARKVINGLDKAELIAEYARRFALMLV